MAHAEDDEVICTFNVEEDYVDDDEQADTKSCEINGQSIDTRSFVVSSDIDAAVTRFVIEGNKNVTFLPIKVGERFPMLLEFEVQSCGIESVEIFTFDNMPILQRLNLRGNEIAIVDEKAFEPLKAVREIYLNGNFIISLAPMTFAGLEALEVINLNDNRINTFNENLLAECANLVTFSANENSLQTIPEKFFANNQKLEVVMLGSNQIKVLGVKLFDGLDKLSAIDLTSNMCVDDVFSSESGKYETLKKFRENLNHQCQPIADIPIIAKVTNTLMSALPSPPEDQPDESSGKVLTSFVCLIATSFMLTRLNFI